MIKGGVIREVIAWYATRHGEDRVVVLRDRLAPDVQEWIDPAHPLESLLPASWYPARLVHGLLEAVAKDHTEAEIGAILREASRSVIRRGGGVYRVLLAKLLTPDLYALAVPRFWRQLHTTGVRSMRITGPCEAESRIEDWAGHHPLLCTCVIETMCAIFEHMGKQDVAWTRLSCVSKGGAACVTRLTWR